MELGNEAASIRKFEIGTKAVSKRKFEIGNEVASIRKFELGNEAVDLLFSMISTVLALLLNFVLGSHCDYNFLNLRFDGDFKQCSGQIRWWLQDEEFYRTFV